MLYGISNGHMLDDVTSLQKVKFVTQIYFESNNLLTLGDRCSVSMEPQEETAYVESNRHVINDVTCVVTPICFVLNILHTAGDTDSVTMEHL